MVFSPGGDVVGKSPSAPAYTFTVGTFTINGSGIIETTARTATLSGGNTYSGMTTVDAGSLLVTGSIASSSLTTVNRGGVLAGTGTVGATQISAGGIFAPGTPGLPGTSMIQKQSGEKQSGKIRPLLHTPRREAARIRAMRDRSRGSGLSQRRLRTGA